MKILAVYYGHNATACLLEDGRVLDCVSEERFTGVKNQTGLPKKSIDYILSKNRLKGLDLDQIVVPVKINAPIFASPDVRQGFFLRFLNFIYQKIPWVNSTYGLVSFYNPRWRFLGRFFYKALAATVGRYTSAQERKKLAQLLGISPEKIQMVDHHTSHAFGAYFSSPYNREKALVLTLDAEGDGICGTVNIFEGNRFEQLVRIPADNSLGLMYAAVTRHLGMKVAEHEYKVMGLAPYAKDYSVEKTYPRVKDFFEVGGRTGLSLESKFDMRQMPRFLKENMLDVRFDVLAAIFQKLLEEATVNWIREVIKRTGIGTLCLAGGVFMNVKLNQKISEMEEVGKLYIMPSCGDESSPLGAGYKVYAEAVIGQGEKLSVPPIGNLYWGPEFSDEDVGSFLAGGRVKEKYQVEYVKGIEDRIAALLAQGKVVGRVKGRMEWGARALGNRSILASPSDPGVVMVINEQMKDRDFWMPFAPTILDRRADDYLINPKKAAANYMILSFDTTPLGRKELKAALHSYDFTCRPQVLTESWNPSYYQIIKEFEKLTGIGAVLNTSFNLHGYPIVLGPAEAFYAFEHSGLEYLALESYLVSKILKQ